MEIEIASAMVSTVTTRFKIDPDDFERKTGKKLKHAPLREIYDYGEMYGESEVIADSPEYIEDHLYSEWIEEN